MKKNFLFLLVIVAFALPSCSLFDKVDDVNFDVKLYKTLDVSASGSLNTLSITETIDASSNSDIAKYKNKIKGYTINKITYTISDYKATGSVTLTNGQFSFSSGSNSAVLASFSEIKLKDLNDSQAESTLSIDQAGLSAISDILLKDSQVKLTASGTLSSTPVAFKVNTVVYVTVKADAL